MPVTRHAAIETSAGKKDEIILIIVRAYDVRICAFSEAVFSGHGFEFAVCGVGPRQQVVDLAIRMAVDNLCEDV